MTNQLKSICNIPFKDSHSHPILTCFPIFASNALASISFEDSGMTNGSRKEADKEMVLGTS